MSKLVWALLCNRVILDHPTNLVSYVDALDAVVLSKFPIDAPPITIGTLWQREDEDRLEMRVVVFSPGGERVMDAEAAPLDFAPTHKRGRMNVAVAGFPIAGPGRFEFAIETRDKGKWREVTRVPFEVEAPTAVVGSAVLAKRRAS